MKAQLKTSMPVSRCPSSMMPQPGGPPPVRSQKSSGISRNILGWAPGHGALRIFRQSLRCILERLLKPAYSGEQAALEGCHQNRWTALALFSVVQVPSQAAVKPGPGFKWTGSNHSATAKGNLQTRLAPHFSSVVKQLRSATYSEALLQSTTFSGSAISRTSSSQRRVKRVHAD